MALLVKGTLFFFADWLPRRLLTYRRLDAVRPALFELEIGVLVADATFFFSAESHPRVGPGSADRAFCVLPALPRSFVSLPAFPRALRPL